MTIWSTASTGLAAALCAGLAAGARAEGFDPPPPVARPGQCFARTVEPARFHVEHEQVLVAPGRVDTRTIPARRHLEAQSVLLEPGRRETVTIPPVLQDVTETVVVRPASLRVDVVPAQYQDVPETVMVSPPRRYWRRSAGVPGYGPAWPGQTRLEPTGEIVCLVEEPAIYRTVYRHVCVQPERRIETPVPAQTRLVVRRVVVEPARTQVRVIPARFGERQVEVVDAPEQVERIDVPPVYRDVERQVQVAPERRGWTEVACAPPAPPSPCPSACAPPPPPPPGYGYGYGRPRPRHRPGYGHAHAPRAYVSRPYAPHGCAPCAAAPRAYAVPPSGPVGNPVADMERALAGRGYYRGPIDGLFTPAAGEALHRFQRTQGLREGPLTGESARALGVAG